MFLVFDVVWLFGFLPPVAAADDEWINGDQQCELFEALAEFSHCRRSFSTAGTRVAGKALGRIFLLTHFVRAKRVRRRQGAQPLGLLVGFLQDI